MSVLGNIQLVNFRVYPESDPSPLFPVLLFQVKPLLLLPG